MSFSKLNEIEARWWGTRILPLVKKVGCFACVVNCSNIDELYYKKLGRPVIIKQIKEISKLPAKIYEKPFNGPYSLTPRVVLSWIPLDVRRNPEIDAYYVKMKSQNKDGSYDAEITLCSILNRKVRCKNLNKQLDIGSIIKQNKNESSNEWLNKTHQKTK